MTPIPEVKPTITGSGMYLITDPRRAAPIPIRINPAMKVAICNPAMPCCAVISASTAMKAPVGPEICNREPPKSEVQSPATMAVYTPCSGRAPEAMAKAIASGNATTPTISPARTFRPMLGRLSSPAR